MIDVIDQNNAVVHHNADQNKDANKGDHGESRAGHPEEPKGANSGKKDGQPNCGGINQRFE